jgi:hypothetical protein
MGEYGAAAPNETKRGTAENRRVEVKLLVNKGIADSKESMFNYSVAASSGRVTFLRCLAHFPRFVLSVNE